VGQNIFDDVVVLGVCTDHALTVHFVVFVEGYFGSE
jgi:hypothetical protein